MLNNNKKIFFLAYKNIITQINIDLDRFTHFITDIQYSLYRLQYKESYKRFTLTLLIPSSLTLKLDKNF